MNEVVVTILQKPTKTRDMQNQTEFLQPKVSIEFLPHRSDMPYRVFISEDPIGFDGGDVNLYAYVANNPVLRIDPSGLFSPGPTCMVCEGNSHPLEQMASSTNVYSNDVNLTGEQWAAYAGVGLGAPAVAAAGVLAVESAPAVAAVNWALSNPATLATIQREGSDFVTALATPNSPPPTSAGGYAGALLGAGYKYWNSNSVGSAGNPGK